MSWPVEPNVGTILVVLWFGVGPTLLMFLLYRAAYGHPIGQEDDAMAEQAERLIAAEGLRE